MKKLISFKQISLILLTLFFLNGNSIELAAQDDFSGWYNLKTQFRGDKECLEANGVGSSYMKGASFMDDCQNVTGQIWKFTPAGNGYYYLQIKGDTKRCLEASLPTAGGPQGGATFMDNCRNVTGQHWKPVDAGNGYYKLMTEAGGNKRSLEGNERKGKILNGNAFMDDTKNVSGQLWKLEKIN